MFGPAPISEPKLGYVSIDIETLGLDPDYCDIIEFGAIIDDYKSPLDKLPSYHRYITKEGNRYQGEAMAMAMHQKILQRIAERGEGYAYMPTDCLDESFSDWLTRHGMEKPVIAGKNFANFDLNFLKKIGFGQHTKFHRRILDVGSMFFVPYKDAVPPDLKECLSRASIEKSIAHTALDDALDVIRCIRYKYGGVRIES